jgi:uncharacterized ion transporter superfamily protein YfcC
MSLIIVKSGLAMLFIDIAKPSLLVNPILGMFVLYILFICISIIIPSMSGFAYAVFGPMIGPTMIQANATLPTPAYPIALGISASSITNGLIGFVSPTSGTLVVGCQITKISLKNYFKIT